MSPEMSNNHIFGTCSERKFIRQLETTQKERCGLERLGHTSRELAKFHSEINYL